MLVGCVSNVLATRPQFSGVIYGRLSVSRVVPSLSLSSYLRQLLTTTLVDTIREARETHSFLMRRTPGQLAPF